MPPTACMRNSGFSVKSKVFAFNNSQSQTESEVLFNPLLLIHANRYFSQHKKLNTLFPKSNANLYHLQHLLVRYRPSAYPPYYCHDYNSCRLSDCFSHSLCALTTAFMKNIALHSSSVLWCFSIPAIVAFPLKYVN
jgi:hypothetical protein